jgi:hypothetical protein
MRTFSHIFCLLVALLATSTHVQAEEKVDAELLIILASEKAGTIDPALSTIPALSKAPFTAFKSMSILSRPTLHLEVGKPSEHALPNGRKISLIAKEKRKDGRYQLSLSVNKPKQKDYLPLLQVAAAPGDYFFVVGQAYKDGTLIIGVRVNPS